MWIRIFPDKPVTQKPAETRMGSGKGNPEYWVAVVKPGRIHVRDCRSAARDRRKKPCGVPAMKMPMDCRFVSASTWASTSEPRQ